MSAMPGDYMSGSIDRGAHQGLPNNTEAEANVLSAMLLSPEVIDDAVSALRIDDFYRPAHRELFEAMVSMNERGIPVDSISVLDYLNSQGKLSAVGGEAYILELVGNTISLVNWQHHAEIMRRDSLLRELIFAAGKISDLAYDAPLDAKEAVEQAESLVLKVTDREVSSAYRTLTDFMVEAYNEASEVCAAGGQAHGVPTGFPSLDRLLLGLREGQLIILGARPAVGKTSFALNLALNAAAEGYTVGFFSLEMSGKEIAQRLICAQAMLSISDFRTGRISPEQWANINEATQELSKLDILIGRYARNHDHRDSREGAPHAPQQGARHHHLGLPAAREPPSGTSCREPLRRGFRDEPRPQDPCEGPRRAGDFALAAQPCRREPYRQAPAAL